MRGVFKNAVISEQTNQLELSSIFEGCKIGSLNISNFVYKE